MLTRLEVNIGKVDRIEIPGLPNLDRAALVTAFAR